MIDYSTGLLRESPDYISKVRDFASDYWDLGAAIALGFSSSDFGNETLGAARIPVFLGSAVALGFGVNGRDYYRRTRNICGAVGSLIGFWVGGLQGACGATPFIIGSALADRERRKSQRGFDDKAS